MRGTLALNGLNRGGGVNKQGVEHTFDYFDPNGANVFRFTYIQTKLQFLERGKSDEATGT